MEARSFAEELKELKGTDTVLLSTSSQGWSLARQSLLMSGHPFTRHVMCFADVLLGHDFREFVSTFRSHFVSIGCCHVKTEELYLPLFTFRLLFDTGQFMF
jgi:hypothetical protein